MSDKKIKLDQLANEISNILIDYDNTIQKETQRTIKEVGNNAVQGLRKRSPVGKRGRYRLGWKLNESRTRTGVMLGTVWNATDYQLTHLLEFGHATRNGKGRTKAIPHIRPVEKEATKEYEQKLEDRIKEAGK